jgi:hypothetical protein
VDKCGPTINESSSTSSAKRSLDTSDEMSNCKKKLATSMYHSDVFRMKTRTITKNILFHFMGT